MNSGRNCRPIGMHQLVEGAQILGSPNVAGIGTLTVKPGARAVTRFRRASRCPDNAGTDGARCTAPAAIRRKCPGCRCRDGHPNRGSSPAASPRPWISHARRNRDVVEEAKSHRTVGQRVMAGRTHDREGVVRRAVDHRLDRGQHAARGQQRGVDRSRARCGCRGRSRSGRWPRSARPSRCNRGSWQSAISSNVASRGDRARAGALEPLGHLDHHLDPLGAFGMGPAGKMVEVPAVGDQRGLEHR